MSAELTADKRTNAREIARMARSAVVSLGHTTSSSWRSCDSAHIDPAMRIFLSEKTTHPVGWSVEVYIEDNSQNITLTLRYTDEPEEVETYREGLWTLHLDNLLRYEGPADEERKPADEEREPAPDRFSPIDDSALFGHLGARPCRE